VRDADDNILANEERDGESRHEPMHRVVRTVDPRDIIVHLAENRVIGCRQNEMVRKLTL
jgi:hypothetical protein